MLGQYTLANNVRTTLNTAITAVSTSIILDPAVGEFNNFPDPTGDTASNGTGIATLSDSLYNPTQTEIITYTGVTFSGGLYTLTGVVRGAEGTTARIYAVGAAVFQSVTAAQHTHPYFNVDLTARTVAISRPTTVNGAVTQQDSASSGFMTSIAGGVINLMRYATGFKSRFTFAVDGTESGSNAGSDLTLATYADTGFAANSQAIVVKRSTGNVGLSTTPDATAKLSIGGLLKATSAAIAGAFSVTGALALPGSSSQLIRGDGALATMGTAAAVNTGTSSGTIPLCNSAITWSGATHSHIATNFSMSWATTSFAGNGMNFAISDSNGIVTWKMGSTTWMTVNTTGALTFAGATFSGAVAANGIINSSGGVNVFGVGLIVSSSGVDFSSASSIDTGGLLIVPGSTAATAPTGSVNNVALPASQLHRLTGSGAGTWTGMIAGAANRTITIVNAATGSVTLAHENASSTAGNRFSLPGNASYVIATNDSVSIWYDSSSARWRIKR